MTFANQLPKRLPGFLGGLSLIALMVALPAPAGAQICATNANCPAGTTCQANQIPDAKPGCAGPDCPVTTGSGGSTGGAAIIAPEATRMSCAPAPCKVDADCGAQMVCHTETISACSGGSAPPCARDTKCDPVPPATCTETKISACAYQWQLPCRADADCGTAFACEPNVISTCSGGGATPVMGGTTGSGDVAMPTPGAGGSSGSTPMCTTMTSLPGWCRAKATTCNTDADCPAPWTCVDGTPSGGTTTDVGGSGTGSGGATRPVQVDGGGAPPPETIVARVKVCQSPVSFPVAGGVAQDGKGSGTPPTGGTTTSRPGSSAPESAKTSNAGCSIASVAGAPAPLADLAGLLLGLALVVRRVRRR